MIRVGELRDLIAADVNGEGGGWRVQLDALRDKSRRVLASCLSRAYFRISTSTATESFVDIHVPYSFSQMT